VETKVLREEGDTLVYDVTESLSVFGYAVNVRPHACAHVCARVMVVRVCVVWWLSVLNVCLRATIRIRCR
jgi:hypothetical protein